MHCWCPKSYNIAKKIEKPGSPYQVVLQISGLLRGLWLLIRAKHSEGCQSDVSPPLCWMVNMLGNNLFWGCHHSVDIWPIRVLQSLEGASIYTPWEIASIPSSKDFFPKQQSVFLTCCTAASKWILDLSQYDSADAPLKGIPFREWPLTQVGSAIFVLMLALQMLLAIVESGSWLEAGQDSKIAVQSCPCKSTHPGYLNTPSIFFDRKCSCRRCRGVVFQRSVEP